MGAEGVSPAHLRARRIPSQMPALSHSILKREHRFQLERSPIELRVGINEIVQRLPLLRRVQANVAPDSELHAVVVMRAEKIILLLRMLPSFGRIHRDPPVTLHIKLRPAVISRYRSGMLFR